MESEKPIRIGKFQVRTIPGQMFGVMLFRDPGALEGDLGWRPPFPLSMRLSGGGEAVYRRAPGSFDVMTQPQPTLTSWDCWLQEPQPAAVTAEELRELRIWLGEREQGKGDYPGLRAKT